MGREVNKDEYRELEGEGGLNFVESVEFHSKQS